MKNLWKKLVAGIFVFALVFAGMNLLSVEQNKVIAADATEESVKYYVQAYTGAQVKAYKDANTAPVPTPAEGKEQYNDWIFAGWFTNKACTAALDETINEEGTYYAKYVPSEVLSVKAQVKVDTTAESEKTDIRLVATVDSLSYKSVGFEVYYNGSTSPVKIKSTTVYSRIEAAKDGVEYGFSPNIFDTQSEYFITATLKNVANKNFGNSFYIRPYWETLDGTITYGVSRYARVEDSYLNIVNVPVRVVSDATTATTGTISVAYPTGYFTYADAYGTASTPAYANGEVFDSVTVDGTTTAGTVVIIGTATAAQKVNGEVVHLRLKVQDGVTLPKKNTFTVTSSDLTTGVVVENSIYNYFGISAVYNGTPDDTWYDANETEFVLTTAEELYGLAKIVDNGNLLTDKIIYLASDITVNTGNAIEWAAGENITDLKAWTPIGAYVADGFKSFKGTFDGNNHTIKGLYMPGGVRGGLFENPIDCTIKNLKLTNSYIKGNEGTGSIAGWYASGIFENIYSDAIVKAETTAGAKANHGGGLFALLTGATTTVNNCWFDGQVSGKQYVGGITSITNTAGIKFTNCLNSGTVSASTEEAGGITGRVSANVTIEDCVNVGKITATNKESGGIIGQLYSGTVTADRVYTLSSANSVAVGNGTVSSGIAIVEDLNDYNGYANTELDFENYWVLRQNATPVLKSWVTSGALYVPKTDWTGTGTKQDPYIIKTPEQLYGLANSVNAGEPYTGKYFKLGANITINSGTASRWEDEAPKYNWIPIGAKNVHFEGSFNGANYTIKGLYAVSSTTTGLFVDPDAITVTNLKLTNSYLEGGEGSAAIAGWQAGGTFDSIYTDAIVVTKNHGAGIAALINEADTKITNCWFDGELIGKKYVGGLTSYISAIGVEISNCLVTAPITSTHVADSNGTRSYAAGMIGDANVTLTMTNCLVGGDTMITGTDGMTYLGSIAGRVGTSSTISNVYAETAVCSTTANNGNLASITKVDDLTGGNGYLNTYLTFDRHEEMLPESEQHDGVWVARTGKVPGLKSFVAKEDRMELVNQSMYRADKSWYNTKDTTFTIDTADELVGFMQLVNENNSFAGKTVQLGADITLNVGNASDWYAGKGKTKLYNWIPIGNGTGITFSGTFDGKGHSIAGVYGEHKATNIGFFGKIADGSTVRDFKLTNSFFTTNAHQAAAICGGNAGGTLDTIYTDAYVVLTGTAQHAGGIVSAVNAGTTIKNCWFDGTVKGNSTYVGGITSFVGATGVTIESCLNSGDITGSSQVGGIVGRTGASTTIKDSLNVGTIKATTTGTAKTRVGAIIGWPATANTTATLENVYALGDTAVICPIKDNAANAPGIFIGTYASIADLTGANGFLNTWLTFDRPELPTPTTGKWVAVTGETPVLKSFVEFADAERLALTGQAMYRTDTRWYDENAREFTITTAEQLIGFASLVNGGKTFADKTVTLGADITINGWNAKDYNNAEVTAKLYNGPVIGDYGWHSDFSISFSGTFDGASHSVSGMYVNKTGNATPSSSKLVTPSSWCAGLFGRTSGATIQNISVLNSYFVSKNYTGGIVGDSDCTTLANVYSDAIVSATESAVAGIAGRQVSGSITKAQFAGNVVSAKRYVAGITGVAAIRGEIAPIIDNCIVTGSVVSTLTSNNASVGGILGETQSDINITNCLVDAKEISAKNKYCVGSVIGCVGASKTATTSNLYVVDGNCSDLITAAVGKHSTNAAGTVSTAPIVADDLTNYKGYMNTSLDFDNTWVAMEESAPRLQIFAPAEGRFDTTSWFIKAADGAGTTAENPYIIDSLADLYGFTRRVKDGNTFENQYIKLTKSIVANTVEDDSTVAEWATEAPYYVWSPIGGYTNQFKGNFDGGMNTVSGLYATASYGTSRTTWYTGMFGYVNGATIENVRIEDSYFYAANYSGSAVGALEDGTVSGIYSNSVISGGDHAGGIVGNMSSIADSKCYIKSSWFDGEVTGKQFVGGIADFSSGAGENYIQHCLNTGTVKATTQEAGGVVGRVAAVTFIEDCLGVGTVTSANADRGSIVGWTEAGSLTMTSVYGYSESDITNGATKVSGGTKSGITSTGGTQITDLKLIYDAEAYERLNAGYWAARVRNYPIPSVFATDADYAKAATKNALYASDTTFEQEQDGTYLISSAAELYGLASLSQKDSFEGKTFKLTNNITINHQKLDENTTEATSYEWLPIGSQSVPFKGNFNGDGHTISGLYKYFDNTYDKSRWTGLFDTTEGCVVENLNIENTYFTYVYNGVNKDPSRIGSIAGYGGGTFRNIRSTASLINDGRGTGGIIGQSTTNVEITNCWFGGEAVCETTFQSSYLGGLIGFATTAGNVTIAHSHVSGDVLGGSYHVGGLVGNIQGAVQATITDSMFNGNFKASDDASGDVFKHGQLVGTVVANAASATGGKAPSLTVSNCYGVNNFASYDVGALTSYTYTDEETSVSTIYTPTVTGSGNVSVKEDRLIGYAGNTASLDYSGYWVLTKSGTPMLKSFAQADDIYDGSQLTSLFKLDTFSKTLANAEEVGAGRYTIKITGSTKAVYDAYCEALDAGIFDPYNNDQSSDLNGEGVYNKVYTSTACQDTSNDDWYINATYLATNDTNGTITITVSSAEVLSQHLKADSIVSYDAEDGYTTSGLTPTFHMIEQKFQDPAASYVIQLSNGHLIVIDGGVNSEAPYLMEYLESLVPEGKKPIVEAWVLSHAHMDHIDSFRGFVTNASKYQGKVYLEGIYFSEASDVVMSTYDDGHHHYTPYIHRIGSVFQTIKGKEPQVYRMYTGQRYTFDTVVMDIMLANEQFTLSDYVRASQVTNPSVFNETSTWTMFTINGKKLLTAGDSNYIGKEFVVNNYSEDYLTVDIFTALHHGENINREQSKQGTFLTGYYTNNDEFSNAITVKGAVLYSYPIHWDDEEEKTTITVRINSFMKLQRQKDNGLVGIPTTYESGSTGSNNPEDYFYHGQGTVVLTFGDSITANVKAHNDWVNEYAPATTTTEE